MALILSIDTSNEKALISLANDDQIISFLSNTDQKDHASFLHPALKDLLQKADHTLSELDAVAVVIGPGSYTGLKVAMATAKGLCYALQIPLISLNGLELLALSAINSSKKNMLYCPMIDARRMEVYTALYDENIKVLIEPCAMILDRNSFSEILDSKGIYFFGNGAPKFSDIIENSNAFFIDVSVLPEVMTNKSYELHMAKIFADPATAEPLYLKEFYTIGVPKK